MQQHNRRKSSFAQLVSPLPHKTITLNSPTIHRRSKRTHSGSDDELVSTIPSSLRAPCETSPNGAAAFEREPTMTFFESDEENEEDDESSRDRQLYLEAEVDFRELMGYNAVYRSRQNSFEKTKPPVDMKHSYGLSTGDSSGGEDDYDVDDLTFPRLGQSPEPIMISSVDEDDDETPVWEPPPFRASNPITKNEIFGWNGVVADVDALKTNKMLLPPHEYFDDGEEQDLFWSRHQAAATFTPPRRRTRIKSEPNVRFWHLPDDGVQCC